MKVEWSPLALDRVTDIARYIAKDNPGAAERWVNELFDAVERLADFRAWRTLLDTSLREGTPRPEVLLATRDGGPGASPVVR